MTIEVATVYKIREIFQRKERRTKPTTNRGRSIIAAIAAGSLWEDNSGVLGDVNGVCLLSRPSLCGGDYTGLIRALTRGWAGRALRAGGAGTPGPVCPNPACGDLEVGAALWCVKYFLARCDARTTSSEALPEPVTHVIAWQCQCVTCYTPQPILSQ